MPDRLAALARAFAGGLADLAAGRGRRGEGSAALSALASWGLRAGY